jgi:hypothetical protein
MALVKAKRDELLGPLSAVSGIIERRHTLPILSNVLIDRVDDVLSFLATDIEIQITARSAISAGSEARPVTVGARKFVDILRALPDGVEVTVTQQEKRLQIKAGKSRFTLQTLPAEDFPRLARPSGEVARFALAQKALRKLLGLEVIRLQIAPFSLWQQRNRHRLPIAQQWARHAAQPRHMHDDRHKQQRPQTEREQVVWQQHTLGDAEHHVGGNMHRKTDAPL